MMTFGRRWRLDLLFIAHAGTATVGGNVDFDPGQQSVRVLQVNFTEERPKRRGSDADAQQRRP